MNISRSNHLLNEPIKGMPNIHILKARASICDQAEMMLLPVAEES